MREKDLTKEYILEHLSYDKDSGVFTWRRDPRNQNRDGSVAGWADPSGYIRIEIFGRAFRASRLAFFLAHGYFPKSVDHINRVRQDNRSCNLRDGGIIGNARNKGKNRLNTSGFKGVGFDKDSKKWRARIRMPDGSRKCLGRYETPEEASDAYESAAYNMHGAFYYRASSK